MYYIDSHCHLNDEAYTNDLDQVLKNMYDNKVLKAMIVSLNLDDLKKAKNIVYSGLEFKYSLGVFPDDVDLSEESFSEYVNTFKEVDAIGEIGLDYHWRKDNKERQKEIFERQLKIAKDLDKPIIVHARDAMQDSFDLLKKYGNRGVLHCYSGSAQMAKELVKLGYYISIAGTVTFKNAREALEVIKAVPLERLLIETDCPYLTPVPYRGKRNEPAYVVYTGQKIADELGIDIEKLMEVVSNNYEEVFRI